MCDGSGDASAPHASCAALARGSFTCPALAGRQRSELYNLPCLARAPRYEIRRQKNPRKSEGFLLDACGRHIRLDCAQLGCCRRSAHPLPKGRKDIFQLHIGTVRKGGVPMRQRWRPQGMAAIPDGPAGPDAGTHGSQSLGRSRDEQYLLLFGIGGHARRIVFRGQPLVPSR
ncbi:hypothetical protein BN2497_9309 [Janthinobacterium sp. CG23_2]|nr:hypothetical protein BN2497_9309 [Janthinobacterium sp. CG23_2]CUU31052.1 hypothetical protein BN3177_9309 [Janthinobacterium sp. CG23_2]